MANLLEDGFPHLDGIINGLTPAYRADLQFRCTSVKDRGTRDALSEKNRHSITITVNEVSPKTIGMLIAFRALQGVGLAASVVCARAMVRDLYEPQEGAHVMAWALSGLGVIALLSPILGGALTGWLGWRTQPGRLIWLRLNPQWRNGSTSRSAPSAIG